ncbi:MAG: GNAT family N-acetyltransferase [Anaerolineaceae bacterium]|jgi:RimJ/RimL family protein N-acetyltransferase
MSREIHTPRLILFPLSLDQICKYQNNPAALETELKMPVSRDVVDETIRREFLDKINQMQMVDPFYHDWCTYWLIVIRKAKFGAGLVGFKGAPDEKGSVEIGYGMDPSVWNQGYMTEAASALVAWAFEHLECQQVTVSQTVNPASLRVLQKLGFRIVAVDGTGTSWEKNRKQHNEILTNS